MPLCRRTPRWLPCYIMLAAFVPLAVLDMDQPIKLDFLWAGLCLMGAVYFILRN